MKISPIEYLLFKMISGFKSHAHQPTQIQNIKSVWLSILLNFSVAMLCFRAIIPSKTSDNNPKKLKLLE